MSRMVVGGEILAQSIEVLKKYGQGYDVGMEVGKEVDESGKWPVIITTTDITVKVLFNCEREATDAAFVSGFRYTRPK